MSADADLCGLAVYTRDRNNLWDNGCGRKTLRMGAWEIRELERTRSSTLRSLQHFYVFFGCSSIVCRRFASMLIVLSIPPEHFGLYSNNGETFGRANDPHACLAPPALACPCKDLAGYRARVEPSRLPGYEPPRNNDDNNDNGDADPGIQGINNITTVTIPDTPMVDTKPDPVPQGISIFWQAIHKRMKITINSQGRAVDYSLTLPPAMVRLFKFGDTEKICRHQGKPQYKMAKDNAGWNLPPCWGPCGREYGAWDWKQCRWCALRMCKKCWEMVFKASISSSTPPVEQGGVNNNMLYVNVL